MWVSSGSKFRRAVGSGSFFVAFAQTLSYRYLVLACRLKDLKLQGRCLTYSSDDVTGTSELFVGKGQDVVREFCVSSSYSARSEAVFIGSICNSAQI